MSTPFLTAFPNKHGGRFRLPRLMVSVRGGRTPRFGKRLQSYRRKVLGKRSSLDQVSARLKALGFQTGKRTILEYERGRPPHIAILWGLCDIYRVDFSAHCVMVVDEIRHEVTTAQPQPKEPLSDAAMDIASAFDHAPEDVKDLIRQALKVGGKHAEPPATQSERVDGHQERVRDSREPARRSR